MAKMNRRDYLKSLGVGAGTIAGAKLDLFAQGSRRDVKHPRKPKLIKQSTTASILNWPVTNTPPPLNPFVTAIFSGLMGFSYDKDAVEGLVGFHPGDDDHKLGIKIYRKPGCLQTFPPPPLPNNIKKITLKVIGQSGKAPEYFQTVDNYFDRLKGHDNDFRWLPDLDSADFYPEGYSKHKHFKAMLHMKHGTFYTRVRTNSTFKLVNAETNLEVKPFGHVAMYMAAAIDVQGTDYVSLQINDETPVELHPSGRVTYQIIFTNGCWHNGSDCVWYINDPHDETKRNDFHFNRKVLKVPDDRIKYALRIDEKASAGAKPNFCPDIGSRNTDEAPCMGSGYGQDRV